MTEERWSQIEELFHQALERPAEERHRFLSEVGVTDQDLLTEVESLLQAHDGDAAFLNRPAYEVAADSLLQAAFDLQQGKQIGPYTILAPLAAGGMGEVYTAHDTRLGRKVALKVLPADFAHDQHRIRRFAQEARAASKTSHPNVCVIHEVDRTADGRHFIAMEFIRGITLRKRITNGGLSLRETLAIAEQIAAALAAAHEAGVVHRDVKPENIMIDKEGFVKVLDFGLAKLRPAAARDFSQASTIAHTEPGTHMGTIKYMAPEQLRERPVDERADIWSFGVLLHEMVTGTTPFEAESRNDTIALILKHQAVRLFLDHAPAEFRRIVARALRKNISQRYRSMTEIAADLITLRRGLEAGRISELPLIMAPGRLRDGASDLSTRPPGKTTSELWSSARTFVSHKAGQFLSGIGHHPKTTIVAGIMAVIAFALIGANVPKIQRLFSPSASVQTRAVSLDIRPFTNLGQSVCSAISPDGALIAHVEQRNGLQELLLTNVDTLATSVLAPATDLTYRGLTFSKDGTSLYITRSNGSNGGNLYSGQLYQAALPNGPSRQIREDVDSPITFSPAGERYAFVRFDRAAGASALIIADSYGSGERVLAVRRTNRRLSNYGPAWSPNGKTIVCASGDWTHGSHMTLIAFEVETGQERIVGSEEWFAVQQVAWLNDNRLVIDAREQLGRPLKLWRVSYPDGEASPITHDPSDYEGVSVAGDKIVSVRNDRIWKLWVAPDGDTQRAVSITSGVGLRYGIAWTENGKIVYSSMAGDHLSLWAINADGSNQTQLTRDTADSLSPATSRDGRFIVFASNRSGAFNIWRINADDGTDPRQLTFTDGNFYPSCSPDSRWVAYDNQSNPLVTAWKVPIEGGDPVQLSPEYARMPIFSPDSQFVAARYYLGGVLAIAILPAQGGPPVRQLPIPVREWQQVDWTPDGQALTYIDAVNGVSNIWSYSLNSGTRKKVTDFNTDQIFAYAWSPDHKQLGCERGVQVRDVVLISNW